MMRKLFFLYLLTLSLFFVFPFSPQAYGEKQIPYRVQKSAYFRKPSGYWTSTNKTWYEKVGSGTKKVLLGWADLLKKSAAS